MCWQVSSLGPLLMSGYQSPIIILLLIDENFGICVSLVFANGMLDRCDIPRRRPVC